MRLSRIAAIVKNIETELNVLIHSISLQTGNNDAVRILCVTIMSTTVIENPKRKSPSAISNVNCPNEINVKIGNTGSKDLRHRVLERELTRLKD